MIKKICPIIFAMLLFIQTIGMASTDTLIAHAAELDGPKLLSGNTLGQLFPVNTQVIDTEAIYDWQQEGIYATNGGLYAADSGDAAKMTDGSVSVVISTYSQSGAADGTLVYDLQAVYRVSALQVWSEFSTSWMSILTSNMSILQFRGWNKAHLKSCSNRSRN